MPKWKGIEAYQDARLITGRKEVVGELYEWIGKEVDEFNSRTGTAKRKDSE